MLSPNLFLLLYWVPLLQMEEWPRGSEMVTWMFTFLSYNDTELQCHSFKCFKWTCKLRAHKWSLHVGFNELQCNGCIEDALISRSLLSLGPRLLRFTTLKKIPSMWRYLLVSDRATYPESNFDNRTLLELGRMISCTSCYGSSKPWKRWVPSKVSTASSNPLTSGIWLQLTCPGRSMPTSDLVIDTRCSRRGTPRVGKHHTHKKLCCVPASSRGLRKTRVVQQVMWKQ